MSTCQLVNKVGGGRGGGGRGGIGRGECRGRAADDDAPPVNPAVTRKGMKKMMESMTYKMDQKLEEACQHTESDRASLAGQISELKTLMLAGKPAPPP